MFVHLLSLFFIGMDQPSISIEVEVILINCNRFNTCFLRYTILNILYLTFTYCSGGCANTGEIAAVFDHEW